MSTINSKYQRQSEEQSSPRAVSKNSKKCSFAVNSPTTSSSSHSLPPRRRDVIKNTVRDVVVNVIRKRSSTAVPQYRGVRYREELNKYVSEIRPTRCVKKIWLGTYDTAEEAARAFDIGNLCCNKNLPLNFSDSPTMLKKISSDLSPQDARSAIAKLAKEVARLDSGNPSLSGEIAKSEPVFQAPTIHCSEYVQLHPHQFQAFQREPQPQPEWVSQILNIAAPANHSETFLEQPPENFCSMEVATTKPMAERGNGSRSWEFDLSIASDVSISEIIPPDDLLEMSKINENNMPDVLDNHMFEDHMFQEHSQDYMHQDLSQDHMFLDHLSEG